MLAFSHCACAADSVELLERLAFETIPDPRRAAAGGTGGGGRAGAGAVEDRDGGRPALDVPLVADARLGASWADVH